MASIVFMVMVREAHIPGTDPIEYRDVVEEDLIWEEIVADADTNLMTGSGARYVIDPTRSVIRVLTDELGLFQAFED